MIAAEEHSYAAMDDRRDTVDLGWDIPEKGTPKRRRTELIVIHTEATVSVTIGARVPEPVAGSATRGKRKRTHRTAADAKRKREAAAFDGTDSDEDGTAPFSAPEVEKSDNPMDVG